MRRFRDVIVIIGKSVAIFVSYLVEVGRFPNILIMRMSVVAASRTFPLIPGTVVSGRKCE